MSPKLTKINPALIRRSQWVNRLAASFADKEFAALKAEIDAASGNIQPIKVRPVVDQPGAYEIIFGHRRHQACLELGLPVLAMVDDLDDVELFAQMDRENRARKDLRPYEQGAMYARALDAGLFASARRMAESLGVDHSNMAKVLTLARLPADLIAAFVSPLDIQVHWSKGLAQAFEKDPDVVLATAKDLQATTPRPSAKAVFDALVNGRGTVPQDTKSSTKPGIRVQFEGGLVLTTDVSGKNQTASWGIEKITPGLAKKIHWAIVAILKSEAVPTSLSPAAADTPTPPAAPVLAPGSRVKILHGTVKGREGKVMRDHGDGTYLVKCRGNTPAAIYYPAQLQVLGAA
jgi:ParB family chromosome partitioning protein